MDFSKLKAKTEKYLELNAVKLRGKCRHQVAKHLISVLRNPNDTDKKKLRRFCVLACSYVIIHDSMLWIDGLNVWAEIRLMKENFSCDIHQSQMCHFVALLVEQQAPMRASVAMGVVLCLYMLERWEELDTPVASKPVDKPKDIKTEVISEAEKLKESNKTLTSFEWTNLIYAKCKNETDQKHKIVLIACMALQSLIRKHADYTMIWDEMRKSMYPKSKTIVEAFEALMEHSGIQKTSMSLGRVAMNQLGIT